MSSTPPEIQFPIEKLRTEKPALFTESEFWPVQDAAIKARLEKVLKGEVECLGRSAGGREIFAVSYGEFEPQAPTATISSAMASDRPAAFYDPARRTRPSLVLIGSIHGGETEGIALCMNLIALLETGADLRGRAHPRLLERLQAVRLVIVPNLNPDGRAAAAVEHLSGATIDELYLVQQGLLADGSPFWGRQVKEVQPIPRGHLMHQGGYYNADGVNLQHDDFFGPRVAPENAAIRALFRREVPDAFLTMHAHGAPAAFLAPDAYVSPGVLRKQVEAAGFVLSRMMERGIEALPPDRIVSPPWSFYFQTWLHHMTGAVPHLFEFCHGLTIRPQTQDQILDTGLVVAEGWIDYALLFGARPVSHEMV